MIDINLTLFIQLGIFLATVVLLNILLFQPVLRVLDRREKVMKDSERLKEDFTRLAEEKMRDYEARLLAAKQEAMNLRGEARAQSQAVFREMVAKSREETLAHLEQARKTLGADAERSRAGIRGSVEALAGDLAASFLGRPAGGKG